MATPAALRPTVGAALHSCRTSSPSAVPLLSVALQQIARISTTSALLKRHKYPGARDNKDHSNHRGESALRRTGTRWRLSMSDEPLPRPIKPEDLVQSETDPEHGLWQFFADRATVAKPPEEDAKHGRAWMVEELRAKSWEDLHKLWWICVKERNRISTAMYDRGKNKLGFGDAEANERDAQVKITMRGIKHVLTERQYVWEDALKLADSDPEIDLSGEGPAFTPKQFLEDGEEYADGGQVGEAEGIVAGEAAEGQTPVKSEVTIATLPSSEPKAQSEAPRI